MLDGRERVVRSICHQEPDRVPVFEPYGVLPPTADKVIGRPCVATSPVRGVEMFARKGGRRYREAARKDWQDLVQELGFDAGPLASGSHYRPEARPTMLDKNTWSVGDSLYRHHPGTGVTLDHDSKIRREGVPALDDLVRGMEGETDAELEDAAREYQIDETLARFWRRNGVLIYTSGGTVPTGSSWIPLFLKCFHMQPRLMKRYLKQKTRRVVATAKVATDFGAELMFIGGDIATNDGPMISPRLYREYILPEIETQARALHRKDAFAFNTSDGRLWPIIEDYAVNSGVDGIMEIQVTAGMDLGTLKDRYGDRLCFTGSVDCQYVLTLGTPREAAEETKRTIRLLSPGGGHILSSSNSIHPGVQPGNYMAMLQAARKYGRYGRS
jgi:hypothetical protein